MCIKKLHPVVVNPPHSSKFQAIFDYMLYYIIYVYLNFFIYSNQFRSFCQNIFFNSLDEMICWFIWNLQGSVNHYCRDADLVVDSISYFIIGLHIFKKNCFWLEPPGPSWCKLEISSCRLSSIRALLYSSLPTNLAKYTDNPNAQYT